MDKAVMIVLMFAAILMMIAVYWHEEAVRVRGAMAVYQGNNEVLLRRLKENYADKVETNKRNSELEQAAAEDKTSFDWGYDIGTSSVIKRLQAR